MYPYLLTADPSLFADPGTFSPTNGSIDGVTDPVFQLLPNALHPLLSSNHLIKDNPDDMLKC